MALNKYNNFYIWYLSVLSVAIPFRKVATPLLIGAIILALPFIFSSRSRSRLTKMSVWACLIIASPFLLDLLFFWNNDSLLEAVKHGEKRASLLVLPIIFFTIRERLSLNRILRRYAIIFPVVLTGLFVRYLILFPENVQKYLKGVHLWEVGYDFANSTSVHAPALNMHIAFLCMVATYFLVEELFQNRRVMRIVIWAFSFITSFFFLIYVNTRLAVIMGVVGILLVLVWKTVSILGLKKSLLYAGVLFVVLTGAFFAFAKVNTFVFKKYSTMTFAHMDKVNQLDDFENPEGKVYGALVTRVSIWNTALAVAKDNLPWGTGAADGKDELIDEYRATDQQFLLRHEFPTHNQYIDFLMKFGVLGLLVVVVFHLNILLVGWRSNQVLAVCFFLLFACANLTDDFLIRFDGIVFSSFWVSLFTAHFLKQTPDRVRSNPESSAAH